MHITSLIKRKGHAIFHIGPNQTLKECIAMLNEKRVGALMVLEDNGDIKGIISERDIMHAARDFGEKMFTHAVKEVMTPAEKLIAAKEDDLLEAVMGMMSENRIRHLPIVEDGKVTCIISIGDVVKELYELALTENKDLKNYITGSYVS
ncbi:CBS domain-containing protein [Oligoflexia bacterium]|nr:CBS domain-containing protein [Oligoflexia bacterium]